jgi:outer membrane lipoprotein SlyB
MKYLIVIILFVFLNSSFGQEAIIRSVKVISRQEKVSMEGVILGVQDSSLLLGVPLSKQKMETAFSSNSYTVIEVKYDRISKIRFSKLRAKKRPVLGASLGGLTGGISGCLIGTALTGQHNDQGATEFRNASTGCGAGALIGLITGLAISNTDRYTTLKLNENHQKFIAVKPILEQLIWRDEGQNSHFFPAHLDKILVATP